MFYYNSENMGEFTNNEKLAQLKVERGEWASYESTEEEIKMQGDGSGYVFASEYVAPPEPEYEPSVEERVAALEESMLAVMFSDDSSSTSE